MNNLNLVNFLQKAKVKTYASIFSFPKLHFDGSKEYIHSDGDFVYKDKYYGSIIDSGQELVFYKNSLVWVMAYLGGMIEGFENLSKVCFSFLKKCLRKIPNEFPVRGPQSYLSGDFKYKNIWTGDLDSFIGEEKIYFKGKQIYFRNYLGGLVKFKK